MINMILYRIKHMVFDYKSGYRRSLDVFKAKVKQMSEKKIKVSVVVATYNQEKYIEHALSSIASQKVNFAIEVIVGDDCSTDGTAAVVKEYAARYPDIFVPVIREKSLGMTGNMMDIILRSRGEYIALLEGDDYWLDEYKLQKQADFLDAHDDYVACFGLCRIIDENDNQHPELETGLRKVNKAGEYTIKDFESDILPGQTGTAMYRRVDFTRIGKKFADAGFDMSDLRDIHMVLIFLSEGRIYNLGEYLSAYRYVMTSGSGSWSSENDYYSTRNLMNYLDGLKNLETIAGILGLELDFDERRLYEWDKLLNNISRFNKEEINMIWNKLFTECNDKGKLNRFRFKKFIKRKIKKFFRDSIR